MRLALPILLAATAAMARAIIDPGSVVVLSAKGDPESAQLAADYARLRGIPASNCIALTVPKGGRETVSWDQYGRDILNPLRAELLQRGLLTGSVGAAADTRGRLPLTLSENPRVRWLVLCRGLPWRIRRDHGAEGKPQGPSPGSEAASVDSELCLLAADDAAPEGPRPNPWFGTKPGAEPAGAERLVRTARLDGASVADVRRVLAESRVAEQRGLRGRAYVDMGGPYAEGEAWFRRSAEICQALGFPTDIDTAKELMGADARFDAPAIYLGWYTAAPRGKLAEPAARLAPGAIALHLHSFSGQALHDATRGWSAALVARGSALTFGNVDEPYLGFTVRPDLLLADLAQGETAGEAAWRATPAMSWMGVILGDPFYRPFARDLKAQLAAFQGPADPLAPYPILRGAALERADPKARRGLLVAGVLACPRLPLLFEIAQDEAAAGRDFGWDNRQLAPLAQEDLGLVLAAARFLKSHGKPVQAGELYEEALRRVAGDPARAKALRDELSR